MTRTWQSLVYFLTDSLSEYSEDFLLLENRNPALFELNGKKYSVHISSVHDSGESRTNEDEDRIQVSKETIALQRERSIAGVTALFIGFFDQGDVFTAWEPAYVFSQNPQVGGGSVYARRSHRVNTLQNGAAFRAVSAKNLGRETFTISLPTNAAGAYVENWEVLHSVTSEAVLQELVAGFERGLEGKQQIVKSEVAVGAGGQRKVVVITRKAFARDPKFKEKVLAAYKNSCCVCSRQLGLVQAAHIVPHAHPDSSDDIRNGLALCVEHHKLYDDKLLMPAPGNRLFLNPSRVEHLQNIGQGFGLDSLREIEAKGFKVPDDEQSRPDDAFLEKGLRLRLGSDT